MKKFNIGDLVVYKGLNSTNKDIWQVIDYIAHTDELAVVSMSRDSKGFSDTLENFMPLKDVCNNLSVFHQSVVHIAEEYANKLKTKKEPIMSKVGNDVVKQAVDANVDAAKVAATITAGKMANSLFAKKVIPHLPVLVRGYADTPVGRVVIANIFDVAVTNFTPTNEKARQLSDAMLKAAMLDFAEQFNFEEIVNDLVSNVSLTE